MRIEAARPVARARVVAIEVMGHRGPPDGYGPCEMSHVALRRHGLTLLQRRLGRHPYPPDSALARSVMRRAGPIRLPPRITAGCYPAGSRRIPVG